MLIHCLSRAEFKTRVVSPDHADGKRSELSYRRIRKGSETSMVEIDLVTGRYHQIRAQLSHVGHPIVGDRKYGSKMAATSRGIHLHHLRVEFAHPTKKDLVKIESPLEFNPILD